MILAACVFLAVLISSKNFEARIARYQDVISVTCLIIIRKLTQIPQDLKVVSLLHTLLVKLPTLLYNDASKQVQ